MAADREVVAGLEERTMRLARVVCASVLMCLAFVNFAVAVDTNTRLGWFTGILNLALAWLVARSD